MKNNFSMKIYYFLFFSIIVLGCSENQSTEISEIPYFSDSLEGYNYYVNEYPSNPEPIYQRAKYFIRNGEINGANIDLKKALQLDSSDLRFHTTYANIQLALLNLEEVKYHYNYVIERDSMNVEALLGMAKLYDLLNNFPVANLIYVNKVI